jgi:hypothetical protein
MADQKGISKLDEKLISAHIIPKSLAGDLPLVHRKMNAILKKTGAILSDEIFETGNEALRKWLNLLHKQGASQEKLTAYLRSGLAHLTYDFIESQYHQIDLDDLVSRTLVSLKNRNLHTSFYKAPALPAKKTATKTKTVTKKIKAIKKVDLAKKAPVKKAPTIKTTNAAKKAPAKKAPAKKASAKKTSLKKTPAKKAIVKKAIGKKKPTAKKKLFAKPPVKKTAAKKKAAPKKTATKATSRKPAAKKVRAKIPARKKK